MPSLCPSQVFALHKKMKFSIKDFFSKCDQIRRNLRIWPHLLTKCLMENFIFCAVLVVQMSPFCPHARRWPLPPDINRSAAYFQPIKRLADKPQPNTQLRAVSIQHY